MHNADVTVRATGLHETVGSRGTGDALTQIFSGLGVGLLLGLIAGLSATPTVQTVLGALASLLAVLLGLQDGSATEDGSGRLHHRIRMNGLRIGSFGFGCVAAILLGLFLRTHDVLAVPMERQVEAWVRAGYDRPTALQFVALQRLGVEPEGMKVVAGELQRIHSGSLFSGQTENVLCDEIRMERFGNDPASVLVAYRQQGDESLGAMADQIQDLPAERQVAMLTAIQGVICKPVSRTGSE